MMTFLADIIAIFESPASKKEELFAIIMLPGQFLGTSSSDWASYIPTPKSRTQTMG